MTFSGSPLDINEALDGLVYVPDANFQGSDFLTVTVADPEERGDLTPQPPHDVEEDGGDDGGDPAPAQPDLGGASSSPDQPAALLADTQTVLIHVQNANATASELFVRSLYVDALGRTGSPEEADGWSGLLQAGASPLQVVRGFTTSPEFLDREVAGFYRDLLHRTATTAERGGWVVTLQAGSSETDVRQAFLTSPEYSASHPGDAAFVAGLYSDVLGRNGSPAEVAGWAAALSGGLSRQAVALDFLTSAEHDLQLIDADYTGLLHRDGEAAGRQGWLSFLQAGGSPRALLEGLLSSPEYYALHTSLALTSGAPVAVNRPVLSALDDAQGASFIDPTAQVLAPRQVAIGFQDYVGPFALLDASGGSITIGSGSDIQDNSTITAGDRGGVAIGDNVIVAYNATVLAGSRVGDLGGAPAFVGINAVIDGATVEGDAMVLALARVAPGIVIHAGMKVLPGKFVQTQDEADDTSLGKVAPVTDADRAFMEGVLHANVALAQAYTDLYRQEGPGAVLGVGVNPGDSDGSDRNLPTLAGLPTADPSFGDRIIGQVALANSAAELSQLLGDMDAIRADEGGPVQFGTIDSMKDRVTVSAQGGTGIGVGNNFATGFHSVIHSGAGDGSSPAASTQIGDNVTVGDWAVVSGSTVGSGSEIGFRAYVENSQLAPGTVVPDRAIIIGGVNLGSVEW
jgi:carbonic anhydrase/acetyltransferase-like protein (isoleucine patch superfamily)